jgi:hypothetical protein
MHDNNKTEIAHELKDSFDAVSPFIEKHTLVVCPECETVCCIDKHGRYERNDLVFLRALEVEIAHNPSDRKETAPCRFLGDTGCCLERWMRPYRCTFFFCDPLLKSLENDNAKLYRAFMQYFQYLVSTRQKLLE